MENKRSPAPLTWFIALVWFCNGLFCKVLGLVPRHEQIVANILGEGHASLFTLLIGISELAMAAWVLSRFTPKLAAIVQITVVLIMNLLEFMLVPDLLLWGRFNALFALLFVVLVYYDAFQAKEKIVERT